MKVALLGRDDRHGYILDKFAGEGHDTLMLSRTHTGAWDGLIDKAPSLQALRDWKPDLVIVDGAGFGPIGKALSDEGTAVFGGNKLQDRLQDNYLFGLGMLEAAGVPTCEHSRFSSIEDAVDYAQTRQQPWAMRVADGGVENFPDTVSLQLHLEKLYQEGSVPPEFALQRGFPDQTGKELHFRPMYYLAGLYNGNGLMQPAFKMSLAHGLFPSGMGIPTFEGVSLSPLALTDEDVSSILLPLQDSLKTVKYVGWVFIGVCQEWNKKTSTYSTCALDFRVTPPDGFWAAFLSGLRMSLEYFFDRVINPRKGNHNTPFEFVQGVVASRKLSLPPYPLTEAPWLEDKEKIRLRDNTPDVPILRSSSVYWGDVHKNGKDFSPCGPVLGYGCGAGAGSAEALQNLASVVGLLNIPFLQVRVEDGLSELHLDVLKLGR